MTQISFQKKSKLSSIIEQIRKYLFDGKNILRYKLLTLLLLPTFLGFIIIYFIVFFYSKQICQYIFDNSIQQIKDVSTNIQIGLAYNLAMNVQVNKFGNYRNFYTINRKLDYYFQDYERFNELVSDSKLKGQQLQKKKNKSSSSSQNDQQVKADENNVDQFKFDHRGFNWYKDGPLQQQDTMNIKFISNTIEQYIKTHENKNKGFGKFFKIFFVFDNGLFYQYPANQKELSFHTDNQRREYQIKIQQLNKNCVNETLEQFIGLCNYDYLLSKENFKDNNDNLYQSEIYQMGIYEYFARKSLNKDPMSFQTHCERIQIKKQNQTVTACIQAYQNVIVENVRQYYKYCRHFFNSTQILMTNKNARINQMKQAKVQNDIIYDDVYMLESEDKQKINLHITNCQNNMKYCKLYTQGRRLLYSLVYLEGYNNILGEGQFTQEYEDDGKRQRFAKQDIYQSLYRFKKFDKRIVNQFLFNYEIDYAVKIVSEQADYVNNQYNQFLYYVIITFVVSSFVTLIILNVKVEGLTKPLDSLQKNLLNITNGDYEQEITIDESSNNQEFYLIQKCFRKLTQFYRFLNENYFQDKLSYDNALMDYANAYNLFQEIDNTKAMGVIHNNIGNIYFKQRKIDLAIQSYQMSYSIINDNINELQNLYNQYMMHKSILYRESLIHKYISLDRSQSTNQIDKPQHSQIHTQYQQYNQYQHHNDQDINHYEEQIISSIQKTKNSNCMKLQKIIDNLMVIKMNRQWQLVNAEIKYMEYHQHYSKPEAKKKMQQLRYKLWEIYQFDQQQEHKSLYSYERMLLCSFMMSNLFLNQNQIKKSHKYLKRAEENIEIFKEIYEQIEGNQERDLVLPYQILASMFDYECAFFYFSIKQYKKSTQILVRSFKKYKIQCQNTRIKQLELLQKMTNDYKFSLILECYHNNQLIDKQFMIMLDFSQSLNKQQKKQKAIDHILKLNEMIWQYSKKTEQQREVGFIRFNKNRNEVFRMQSISNRFKFMQNSIKYSHKLKAEGQSAIFDQIYKSYKHLNNLKRSNCQQYLIVVTDGQDNKSKLTIDDLVQKSIAMKDMRTIILGIGLNEDLTKKYQKLKELNIHNIVVSRLKKDIIEVVTQTIFSNSTMEASNLITESLV